MNNIEDNPENQEGLSREPSPSEIISQMVDKLGELHQKTKEHQSSTVFIYAPGSQYVDKQYIFGKEPHPLPPSPKGEVEHSTGGELLPDELATDKAMELWEKVQQAGYVDEHYQPQLSRTKAALLAYEMADRLGIRNKWKVFGTLWQRQKMYRDYYDALNLLQSLEFQDSLKRLFN